MQCHSYNSVITYGKVEVNIHIGWKAISLIKKPCLLEQATPEGHAGTIDCFHHLILTLFKVTEIAGSQPAQAGNSHLLICKLAAQRCKDITGQLEASIELQNI